MEKHQDKQSEKKMITKDSTLWRSVEEKELHGKLIEQESEFESSPLRDGVEPESDESRREFLKLMAAAGVMFGATACTRRPVEKILPYVKQTDEIVPGVANWYASTCTECSANCGTLVKTREGRPIKIEGNQSHPISKGGLCARGQASVLNLYDPDRLQSSLQSSRTGISTQKLTFDLLDQNVIDKLKAIKAKNGKVVFLTGEMTSPSTKKLISEFLKGMGGNSEHIVYEPLNYSTVAEAGKSSYGTAVLPSYSIEKANLIVTFGADFLGTWGSPVEFSKAFSLKRKLGAVEKASKTMNRLVAFESMTTLTGTNADERFRVRSGDEVLVALAVAAELIVNQGKSKFANDAQVTAVLKNFTSNNIPEISRDTISKLAKELWENQGKSIVFGGGFQASGDHGLALETVVNLINSALENEGNTIHGSSGKTVSSSWNDLNKILTGKDSVDALFIYQTNPNYLGLENLFKNVKFIATFGTSFDETAKASYLGIAVTNSMETWGDAEPRNGFYSIIQPTIAPMYAGTRSFEDHLIAWGKKLSFGGKIGLSQNWYEYLKASWQEMQKDFSSATPFMLFWENLLKKGYVEKTIQDRARTFNKAALSIIEKAKSMKGISLVIYPKIGMYDGRNSNNSWLQELPDPVTKATWGNYVQVSVNYAKANGISDGDVLRVTNDKTTIELPAQVQPGHHDDTISIAMGYGRDGAGQIGDKIGVNVFKIAPQDSLGIQLSVIPVSVSKTGKCETLATTQRHHSMEGRAIIKNATFEEYKKNNAAGNEVKEELVSLWKKHEYPGYRWSMSIDLSACTGCSACVIGCNAENNIPVVGKENLIRSREMHWLRIDRYYSGRTENPETLFQPMMCQQCENAPCETVCPVLATMHDHEGLNQQIYNRCVGTRYCANNCPYKVRRFNWFTFTDVAKPQQLAYNPDVSVRTRGVMEKCTFCIQRVREGKDRAKDQNRAVTDGDIKTACMQSCPTDAISFGNINDKNSRVTKMAKDPRAYYVLEELNVGPSVSYLTKIRNKGEA